MAFLIASASASFLRFAAAAARSAAAALAAFRSRYARDRQAQPQ
jgi:hypothetical protein